MWRHLAASAKGTSHAKAEQPCQDFSISVEFSDPQILLLACSDGAGSGRRSELGSQITCATLLDDVSEFLRLGGQLEDVTRETAIEWIERIRAKVTLQADALGLSSRDLACTLVAALLTDTAAVFLQIGDGAIVTVSEDSTYRVIFWPEQGEYANTTFFVTSPDALERLRVEFQPQPVSGIALFTDGLQQLALQYEHKRAHRPFFEPMFAALRAADDWPALGDQLRMFLESAPVAKRTDDDCTLVLATRDASRM